ncbi:MAG: preprotein translocase subunit SecG [Verrucomicrobiota bacterium]
MIFAATPINWLSLSITVLLVIFVAVCLLMAVVVLIQRPKQDGLGAAFGGGVTDQLFGARSTDVFQKATWVLGTLFFLLCFTLMILISKQNKQKSLLNPEKTTAEKVEKKPEPPVVPLIPPPSLSTELPVEPTVTPETTPAPVPPAPPVTEEAPAPQN